MPDFYILPKAKQKKIAVSEVWIINMMNDTRIDKVEALEQVAQHVQWALRQDLLSVEEYDKLMNLAINLL